jgi:hypothetical protein
MPILLIPFVIIILWYPIYKRFVFPKLLKAVWFRSWFDITEENAEKFNIGLGISDVASGFWFFYVLGFAITALICFVPTVLLFR